MKGAISYSITQISETRCVIAYSTSVKVQTCVLEFENASRNSFSLKRLPSFPAFRYFRLYSKQDTAVLVATNKNIPSTECIRAAAPNSLSQWN